MLTKDDIAKIYLSAYITLQLVEYGKNYPFDGFLEYAKTIGVAEDV